jgi:glycosyltransferase involved in cell wall biosynthesis
VLIDLARQARALHFRVCGDPNSSTAPAGYGAGIVKAMRAEPNIDYLGVLPQQAAHDMIAEASILLSTSDSEGFPNTFLQAWSAGTPVVSLKVDPAGTIERLALGRVSGRLDAALGDLHSLLASAQLCDDIGARAQLYVAGTHSDEAVTAAFRRAIHG